MRFEAENREFAWAMQTVSKRPLAASVDDRA
jgi:hypothetical protein